MEETLTMERNGTEQNTSKERSQKKTKEKPKEQNYEIGSRRKNNMNKGKNGTAYEEQSKNKVVDTEQKYQVNLLN